MTEKTKIYMPLDELLSGSALPTTYTTADTAAHEVGSTGSDAFKAYMDALVDSATENSTPGLAAELALLRGVKRIPADNLDAASVLLRNYVVKRYGDAIVEDLQTMVGFRTYAEDGRENWQYANRWYSCMDKLRPLSSKTLQQLNSQPDLFSQE